MNGAPSFLNLDLSAPGVRAFLDGVVLEDGKLRLAPVHGAPRSLTDVSVGEALEGPAAIAVAPDGTVYVADPPCNRVVRVPACGGPAEEVGCLVRWLREPRGLTVGPRRALYVADTGNDRVLVVDLPTEQVRAAWEDLAAPWDLAADGEGRVYVVESGARRVARFDADGRRDEAFDDALASGARRPRRPQFVVIVLLDGVEHLLVLDRGSSRGTSALVYDLDGAFIAGATRALTRALRARLAGRPVAVAAGPAELCVSEPATGLILSFGPDGSFLGAVRDYQGAGAGLTFDAGGRLVVNDALRGPIRFEQPAGTASGSFAIGPFGGLREYGSVWRRLSARADVPDGAHLRLFTFGLDDETADPPPLGEPEAAGIAGWRALPPDALDGLVPSDPSRWLWIGGRLQGDAGTPVVHGLRVEYDGEGWLRHLPAIYSREQRPFLEPALALLESSLADEERLIDGLAEHFDPHAAPEDWLEWLAGWVALELDGVPADSETRRGAIGDAFRLHDRRGTAEGLRSTVALALGADVTVDEPGAAASLWSLGDASLGAGTGLAAAAADGAVLDSTAVLDRSWLQDEDEYGAATLGALAGRYCVRAYAADLRGEDARELLERLVHRDQPIGTEVHVCVIEPRARVGFQAMVGVDAVVGCEATPMRLGSAGRLGAGAGLASARPQGLSASDRTHLGRAPTVT